MSKRSRKKSAADIEVAVPENERAESAAETTAAEGLAASDERPSPEAALAALQSELQAANDRFLRAKAELDNYRKRAQRDLVEAREYVKSVTLQEFFSPFDHFQMAMAHIEETPDIATIRQGMEMILSEFQRSFENLGVAMLDATGKPFNPEEHEAVAQEASETVPAGTVLRQWKCGYKIGDKLLRPAAVVVSGGADQKTNRDRRD